MPVGYDTRTYQLTSADFADATAVIDRTTLDEALTALSTLNPLTDSGSGRGVAAHVGTATDNW